MYYSKVLCWQATQCINDIILVKSLMFKNEACNKSIIITKSVPAVVAELDPAGTPSLLITQPHEVQLEQLGNGVIYCLLLHHYFPSLLNVKKVCMAPRRLLDNLHNLRILTDALTTLKWNSITFDVHHTLRRSPK